MQRLFLITLLLAWIAAEIAGQNPPAPVSQWIKQLSVREDIRTEKYRAVLGALLSMDSATTCALVKELEIKGPARNIRFQVRLLGLKARIGFHLCRCPGFDDILSMTKSALLKAYELGDDLLVADMSQLACGLFPWPQQFAERSFYCFYAAEIQDQLGPDKFYDIANLRYFLGYIYYHTREYKNAIAATQQALEWRLDTVKIKRNMHTYFKVMDAWNTIGLSYQKLGAYDEAFAAFDSALHYANKGNHRYWQGLLKGNVGDTYFLLGMYDTAKVLLEHDVGVSREVKYDFNVANSLQYIARINLLQGNSRLALEQLKEAFALLNSPKLRNTYPEYVRNIYQGLADTWKAIGNVDSSLVYLQAYIQLHDSLETAASLSRSEVARLRLNNQEQMFRINRMSKEKKQIALIRNFSVALIMLIGLTGYLYFNRQRLRLQMQEQAALQQQRLVESEMTAAQSHLQQFTQSLVEKTELVEKLKKELVEKEISEEKQQIIANLSHHVILTEEDWNDFRILFEKVYPGFFNRLRTRFSDITLAEQRMAAMTRLQLPPKEAAALLGVSHESIHKSRHRLRHRLHVPGDIELEEFVSRL